jgi:hypothetical protein
MQAGEQPQKDMRQGHQEEAVVMRAAETSVREAATAALPTRTKVAGARGANLSATRGTEAAASRAEAARPKGWLTLVS